MFLPKKNEKPNFLLDSNDIDVVIQRLMNNPKGLNREPIFEYILNEDQYVRPYFDFDGTDGNDLSLPKFEQLCENINKANIEKIQSCFKDADISISSYNGFDLSNKKHNTNYNKRKISFHYIITNYKIKILENKTIAQQLDFDTSVYPKLDGQQLFRIGKFHKYEKHKREKGNRKPIVLTHKDDISKHLLQYVPGDCLIFKNDIIMEKEIPKDNETLSTDIDSDTDLDDEICPILMSLPSNFVDNYKDWLRATLFYKEYGNYQDWCIWCKTSSRYIDAWEPQNKKIWDEQPIYNKNGRIALKRLTNSLDREEDIFHLFNGKTNDADIVDNLINEFKDYFKVVNYTKNDIYFYNRDSDLWETITREYLNCYLTKYWTPRLFKLADLISKEDVRADERSENKIISKWFGLLTKEDYNKVKKTFLSNINSQGNTKTKNNYTKEFFLRDCLKDEKFKNKLNPNKHILSVKGGKINLKTKEFSLRTQSDLLSYELDLEYNPEAINNPFEDFISDILTPVNNDNGDGEMSKKYLQRYLGYCLTGETREEKILVLLGGGSNGKSKLFSILQNVLKSNVDICGTWNSDLFNANIKQNNVNNASPEIAKLYGKRLGFINESSKNVTWGEMFKKLVDTGTSLTARELYGASFEFDLTTTFIMCSNEFPCFPIDNCYIRRIDTLNLMNRYVDFKTRDTITENDKPINLNLIEDICSSNRQGILNWLVHGAYEYYKDGLLEIPESQKKLKKSYISSNDWFKNFKITNNKKDFISINAIYENINLLTSCRVARETMIEKFVDEGAVLARKMVNGKKIPILRGVMDNIDDTEPECEIDY